MQTLRIVFSYLDIPILSPDPEIANLYASKSGTKRIFLAAKVDIPPSEFDIYSLPQVSENLMVYCWVTGSGTESCADGDQLPIY
jgi:hypothetical protein